MAGGALFASAVLVAGLPAGAGHAAPAGPVVTGPVTGGNGHPTIIATAFNLATVGYRQDEFFLSGKANAYAPVKGTTLGSDGKWFIRPQSKASYETRMVVYRPVDPAKFNGTVVVEWLNVSGGLDAAVDWSQGHNELIREGYAWVGVSVQKGGMKATKKADPARYSALHHPGDSYSYDIFSDAGRAVRARSAKVLSGLTPKKVIGVGESQSAFRLVTYLDAVHPLAHVYDGYFVHSRFSTGAALSQDPLPAYSPASPTLIRTDLDVPVFVLETETDVSNAYTARQPDTSRFRSWEMAGTAHADMYTFLVGFGDTGDGRGAVAMFNYMVHPRSDPIPGIIECDKPVNAGPQHWVLQAALHHLNAWVTSGTLPPIAPRLELSGSPATYALNDVGNVKGGIRAPQVNTPVAVLRGLGNSGGGFCGLTGTTTPLTNAQLRARYGSHRGFVAAWDAGLDRAIDQGFILPADRPELHASAAGSEILQP